MHFSADIANETKMFQVKRSEVGVLQFFPPLQLMRMGRGKIDKRFWRIFLSFKGKSMS